MAFADTFKALADPARREILLMLRAGRMPAGEIAARFDMTAATVSYHLSQLKKAGLVESIRGAGGGYILAKDMKEISVGDVLRALEGSLEPVECAGLEPDGGCRASDSCVTKYVWQRINESINRTVDEIMLDQLVRESLKKEGTGADRAGCKN